MTMAGEAGVCSDWFLTFVVTRTDVAHDLAVVFNHLRLPLQSVETILEVLAVYIPGVPTSARRLMSTPRSQQANIISLAGGNYGHISLRSTLIEVVNRGGWDHDKIEITLGVDGVGRGIYAPFPLPLRRGMEWNWILESWIGIVIKEVSAKDCSGKNIIRASLAVQTKLFSALPRSLVVKTSGNV